MTVVSCTALFLLVVFPIPSLNTEFLTILSGYLLALFLPGLLIDLVFGRLARGHEEDIASKCGGLQYGGYLMGCAAVAENLDELGHFAVRVHMLRPTTDRGECSDTRLPSRSSFPVPFLGGQRSGVQGCPTYNERYMERSLIFLAILIAYFDSALSYTTILSFLSVIVAGKAIFRYSNKETTDRACADWYILGTFMSITMALALTWGSFRFLLVG